MNSMYNNQPDDFERRLAELSIVEPSDDYANLANTLGDSQAKRQWVNWKPLVGFTTAFALVLVIVIGIVPMPWDESTLPDSHSVSATLPVEETQNSVASSSLDRPFVLGIHYTEVELSRAVNSPLFSDIKIFFSYPCFPCYEFNEILEEWSGSRTMELQVTNVPVTWSEVNRYYARVFYAAESLDLQKRAHEQIFEALHRDNQVLEDLPSMVSLFAGLGISQQQFLTAYNSEATARRVREAEQINQELVIQSAPTLIVDCRYRISPNVEVGQQEMVEVAQYLIDNSKPGDKQAC